MTEKKIDQTAVELAKIYSMVANAKLRCEVLMNNKSVYGNAKHFIKTSIFNRLNAITNDLRALIPDNAEGVEDTIGDEVAMQNDNVFSLYLDLPKEIRNVAEEVITELHNKYSK